MMLRATEASTDTTFLESEAAKYETASAATREIKTELDKDAFMELLIAEMQYQDPLEPVSNKEMMGQLAGFSSLEQMEEMNTNIASMLSNNEQSKWAQAANFIGKNVVAQTDDGVLQGVVDKASIIDGELLMEISGYEGYSFGLDEVVGILDNDLSLE